MKKISIMILMLILILSFSIAESRNYSIGEWSLAESTSLMDGNSWVMGLVASDGKLSSGVVILRIAEVDLDISIQIGFPEQLGFESTQGPELSYISDRMESISFFPMLPSLSSVVYILDHDDQQVFLNQLVEAEKMMFRTYNSDGKKVDLEMNLVPAATTQAVKWMRDKLEEASIPWMFEDVVSSQKVDTN